jgi:hypothetical protein
MPVASHGCVARGSRDDPRVQNALRPIENFSRRATCPAAEPFSTASSGGLSHHSLTLVSADSWLCEAMWSVIRDDSDPPTSFDDDFRRIQAWPIEGWRTWVLYKKFRSLSASAACGRSPSIRWIRPHRLEMDEAHGCLLCSDPPDRSVAGPFVSTRARSTSDAEGVAETADDRSGRRRRRGSPYPVAIQRNSGAAGISPISAAKR